MSEFVDSAGDERTVNNTLRHNYRVLNEEEKMLMSKVKDCGQHFLQLIEDCGDSRELSLAKTKLEEAVMWAVKHITR